MVFMPIYTGVIAGLIIGAILTDNNLIEGGFMVAACFVSVRLGTKISEFASYAAASRRADVLDGEYYDKN